MSNFYTNTEGRTDFRFGVSGCRISKNHTNPETRTPKHEYEDEHGQDVYLAQNKCLKRAPVSCASQTAVLYSL